MVKFWLYLILLIMLAVAGGMIYLMTTDIPAPTQQIEKTLPDDMFPK